MGPKRVKESKEEPAPKSRSQEKEIKECSICAETYNKSNRVPICCEYCSFEACRNCYQTYLMNETRPHCMNTECDKIWTRKFLNSKFTHSFMTNEYKRHREEILWNHERSLFPATQPLVEQAIEVEKAEKEIRQCKDMINQLKNTICEYEIKIIQLQNHRRNILNINTVEDVRTQFVRACPDGECRGFLSTQWKCGLCSKWSCPECHEIKGDSRDAEHTCKPENVETAKLLAKDTKPCPKCGMGIHRISGCDQVWCTLCHTAFSYKTGKIETGHVHNPHYYEWMRQKSDNGEIPREPGDVPPNQEIGGGPVQCREIEFDPEIVHHIYYRMNRDKYSRSVQTTKIPEDMKKFRNYRRDFSDYGTNLIHLQNVIIPRYTFNQLNVNQRLRIMYMRKIIDEDKFRELIQRAEKKMEKTREISDVMNFAYTAGSDIMLRVYDSLETVIDMNKLDEMMNELQTLEKYVNECLLEIAKNYKCHPFIFNKCLEEN